MICTKPRVEDRDTHTAPIADRVSGASRVSAIQTGHIARSAGRSSSGLSVWLLLLWVLLLLVSTGIDLWLADQIWEVLSDE